MQMNDYAHPGGVEITKAAFDACALPKGVRVLDVGCGTGETAAYLASAYGFSVTGLDIAPSAIAAAKKRYPAIEFLTGDGEALPFASHTFDCALLACTLSLFPDPAEAIHEAFCVLKNGGYLIIHDLYLPHPTAEDFAAAARIKAAKLEQQQAHAACVEAQAHDCAESPHGGALEFENPHDCGQCGACGEVQAHDCAGQRGAESQSDYAPNGALILNDIHAMLEELGFAMVLFEDRKADLDNYAASLIFRHGRTNHCFPAHQDRSGWSYFLMVVQKSKRSTQ